MASAVSTAVTGLSSASFAGGPKTSFRPVVGLGDEERLAVVRAFFKRTLEPLYGSQESALAKIESAPSDRICRLLYADDVPIGIIVFKKALSDEFKAHGIEESLEIKTLVLLDAKKFSGRGYASILLNNIIEAAKALSAKSLHVTVSATVTDSMEFFRKKNFVIAHTFDGRYKLGVKEHLLFRKTLGEAETKQADAERKEAGAVAAPADAGGGVSSKAL